MAEPRYTKVKGQSRYYDHVTGRTISHRQYWKLRGEQTGNADKWTPEKAQKLGASAGKVPTAPPPVRVDSGTGPSLLARQLLEDTLAGSPIVDTPPAPGPVKALLTEVADDTKKTVNSLAATASPMLAVGVCFLATLVTPEAFKWAVPDQEEAELVLEPAARLVIRYFGITGGEMGENGKDMFAIAAAMCAYLLGAKARLEEYLENEAHSETREQGAERRRAEYRGDLSGRAAAEHGVDAESRQRRRDDTPPRADDTPLNSPAYAPILERRAQQSGEPGSQAHRSRNYGASIPHGTDRQNREAAKVRELFEADFIGRQRLGIA